MSLVVLNTPALLGSVNRQGLAGTVPAALSNVTIDAANEAIIMIGRIRTADRGTHTMDTSGSSSLQWRSSAVTFANGGTTLKVGLATVDSANGPPPRATNVADVITFSVSKSLTGGGGGVSANAWQSHTPDTGSLSVADGDLLAFCVQMTARGGADSVLAAYCPAAVSPGVPNLSGFTNGSYTAFNGIPNALLVFSDGTRGWFEGAYVSNIGITTQTWNNTSGTKEYGNILQFPFPVQMGGFYGTINLTTSGADCDLVLYSDPLGTPVAQRTISLDGNTISANAAVRNFQVSCPTYSLAANTPYGVIFKPSTATDVAATYLTLNAQADQIAWGDSGYAVNRASGAFASQNSGKDRFSIGIVASGFDAGGVALGLPAVRMS